MDDFLDYLSEQIDETSRHWGLTEGQAFSMWYAIEALDLEPEEAYEAVRIDGGNDKDIDLFLFDEKNERIIIAQSKYNREGKYKGKKGELLNLVHSIDWLSDLAAVEAEGREELVSAATDYAAGLDRGYSVDFQYIYLGPANRDVKDQAELLNKSYSEEHPPKQVRVIDRSVIQSVHEDSIGKSTRIEIDRIKVNAATSFRQKGGYGTALVTTLKGSELTKLYSTHGDKLFARNIRLFLGMRKGSVNAGISSTLSNEKEREKFWAFNNGITIICDNFRKSPKSQEIVLHNFSIVNGCQTTVSLAESRIGEDKKDVDVLTRIIAVPERIIDDVIYYTNSQNPIRGWELKTQDKVQKRLVVEFSEDPNPYYYSLRRGETQTLTKAERRKYTRDGMFQQIKYDQLAQYLAAFRGLPFVAYKDKGRLFTTYYDNVFPVDLRAEEALLAWRCAEAASPFVEDRIKKAVSDGNEEEIFIFKRGGTIFVTSVISMLLMKRNGGNYLPKLDRAKVTSKATATRLRKYAQVGCALYAGHMRAMLGGGGLSETKPDFENAKFFSGFEKIY